MVTLSWADHTLLRRGLSLCALICIVMAWAGDAHTQSHSAIARSLFVEARGLMVHSKYELACPKLEESLKLDSGMGTKFNLAHCWEELGKTASAWAMFLDVAAAAKATNQTKREKTARARAKALVSNLSKMNVQTISSETSLRITRNGIELGEATWGSATPIDPGNYLLVATAPEFETWSQQFEVPANGQTVTVTVPTLKKAPVTTQLSHDGTQANPRERAPSVNTPDRGGGRGLQQTAGIASMGLGVASGAVGVIFSLLSVSANTRAGQICNYEDPAGLIPGNNYCNPDDSSEAQRLDRDNVNRFNKEANDWNDRSIYPYVISGSLVLIGAVLYFTGQPNRSPEDIAWAVVPLLGEQGTSGAQLHLRF